MQAGSAVGALPVQRDGKGIVGFQLKATASVHHQVLDVQVCCCSCLLVNTADFPQCASAEV